MQATIGEWTPRSCVGGHADRNMISPPVPRTLQNRKKVNASYPVWELTPFFFVCCRTWENCGNLRSV